MRRIFVVESIAADENEKKKKPLSSVGVTGRIDMPGRITTLLNKCYYTKGCAWYILFSFSLPAVGA